jgi:DNA polymerase-3 subunit beta
MNVSCKRDQLLNAFQTVAPVVPTRSPKEVLKNIKLTVSEQEAVMMATDTEIGIRQEVSGIDTVATGSVVLPVTRFGSILRESSDEELRIESDGTGILVTGQRSEFRLPAEHPDEFPEVNAFDEDRYQELPARLLRELIRRTLFATDTESSRYALGGILFEFDENRVISVGTDGRRLAKMEGQAQSVNDHHQNEGMTIIPARAMQLVERALTDDDVEIKLTARANDVLLRTPRATIYSRLVEGRYPKWRDVIPDRTNGIRIDFTVGPLFAAVRQAAVVTSEESRGLDLTFENGTLTIVASTAEVGQSHVELPIPYDGEQIKLTLDHRFIADFLKVLDAEKPISLDIVDNDNAALFLCDNDYVYVVMPLSREKS